MRKVLISARIILALLVVAWLAAEANQWLLRHRAEALLADIKALELNRSSWTDAQRLMKRWGRWGGWLENCNPEDCNYSISIDDVLFNAPEFVYDGRPRMIARIFDHLGLRAAGVNADFRVVRGLITNKSYGIEVALPASMWVINKTYWPSLNLAFSESAKLSHSHDHFREIHPNHDFIQRRITLEANFTPEESPDEQVALTDVHFDCITRWSACLDRKDLLPRAEDEWNEDSEYWHSTEANERFNLHNPSCFPSLEIRAREEQDVVVGYVVTSRKEIPKTDSNPRAEKIWKIDVRLDEVLKGTAPVPLGSLFTAEARGGTVLATYSDTLPFSRLVLTGMTIGKQQLQTDARQFDATECGLTEATDINLAAARKGVQEDFGPRY